MNRWDRFWNKVVHICTLIVVIGLLGIILLAFIELIDNVF